MWDDSHRVCEMCMVACVWLSLCAVPLHAHLMWLPAHVVFFPLGRDQIPHSYNVAGAKFIFKVDACRPSRRVHKKN